MLLFKQQLYISGELEKNWTSHGDFDLWSVLSLIGVCCGTEFIASKVSVILTLKRGYMLASNPVNDPEISGYSWVQWLRNNLPVLIQMIKKLMASFESKNPDNCKHDTDWTVSARTVKLGTHTTYDKRTTPIDFQGHGSKVKVTCKPCCLTL